MIEHQGELKVPTDPFPGPKREPHKFLGKELSEEEYREACANLAEFFLVLKGWRDKHGEA